MRCSMHENSARRGVTQRENNVASHLTQHGNVKITLRHGATQHDDLIKITLRHGVTQRENNVASHLAQHENVRIALRHSVKQHENSAASRRDATCIKITLRDGVTQRGNNVAHI